MTAPTRTTVACAGSWPVFNAAFDGDEAATVHAVEICTACDIRSACLAGALERREQWGVWGGTTPDQRADLEARAWLLEPTFREHEPSRACYSRGCDHPDCREQNRLYVASRPRVTGRGAIAVPTKPDDRHRRCDGQIGLEGL